jgi:tellurite resistance protein
MEFFPTIDVSALQAEAIARGLYAVALVDGVHERELALITDFYQGIISEEGGGASTVASLEPLEPKDLAQHITDAAQRQLFVKAAFLLAWADGKISPVERAKIADFSKALDVSAEAQGKLEAEVKDYLLRPLAGLANVEGATAVAKKLGA